MRTKIFAVGIWIAMAAGLAGCQSSRQVIYFQDLPKEVVNEQQYDTRINCDDLLNIIVSCEDVEAAVPFNTPMIGLGREATNYNNRTQPGYLVDKRGDIDFPVLGTLHVEGLTRGQLSEMLKEKLSVYLKNPIVTIQFLNFRVTVLGDVKNPGNYPVSSERISVLDAIGLAGDMQITGKRRSVLVIREQGNEKLSARLDLTSSEMFDSEFFYLKQNDVVYVEPSNSRIVGGSAQTILPYILSSATTVIALLALIL